MRSILWAMSLIALLGCKGQNDQTLQAAEQANGAVINAQAEVAHQVEMLDTAKAHFEAGSSAEVQAQADAEDAIENAAAE